ncbi:hypothetical protein BDV06DRAFT_218589 [Aspergillus oleicola]
MRFLSILSLLATASVCVLAQETSASSAPNTQSTDDSDSDSDSSCDAQNCYNNCPRDPARNGINQQRISYCNAAGQLSSTSASTTATTTATRTSTASATETESASSTSDGAAASETADDGAGYLTGSVVSAGFGLGVVFLGLV